ncbi:CD1375 family protein [Fusibacter sp. JL298sf-3]
MVRGRRTIEQVPSNFRQQVLDELTPLGLDGNWSSI